MTLTDEQYLAQHGLTSETISGPAPKVFEVGRIVKLGEYVGTKAQQKLLWKVTDVGDTRIGIEPVTGGRGLRAYPHQLVHASASETIVAHRVPEAPKITTGMVVALTGKTGTYVITALSTAGTCTISRLGGGAGYTKVSPQMLRIITGTIEVPA